MIYSQDHPKRTSAEIWNSETTQNLNIYLYTYQTETAIFLATKHEKTVMACSFFVFFFNISFILNFWPANESIHLNSWYHSHKKQKDSLETQVLFVIFWLELEIFGVAIQSIHQNSKKW